MWIATIIVFPLIWLHSNRQWIGLCSVTRCCALRLILQALASRSSSFTARRALWYGRKIFGITHLQNKNELSSNLWRESATSISICRALIYLGFISIAEQMTHFSLRLLNFIPFLMVGAYIAFLQRFSSAIWHCSKTKSLPKKSRLQVPSEILWPWRESRYSRRLVASIGKTY